MPIQNNLHPPAFREFPPLDDPQSDILMNIVDMSYQAFSRPMHEPSSLVDPQSDMSMDIDNLSYEARAS
ncbi:hypothetical protein DEO72_LG3g1830 [Vigna unguiculata]|uniref:Uncharacterized protein n=1 Tax=Vigna unguiculata TaxID=3917 RepID=A0A4D6LFW7_VIGUN|nr:hypothetical protein DEO72_LG3g1830 [Vigna unguiculata]